MKILKFLFASILIFVGVNAMAKASGAKHGSTDPDSTKRGEMHHIPVGYNNEADIKFWDKMKILFKKML